MLLFRRVIQAIQSMSSWRRTPGPTQNGAEVDQSPDAPVGANPLRSFTLDQAAQVKSRYLCQIEFIGGPLDGYVERVPISRDQLAAAVAIPIDPFRLTALLEGDTPICGKVRHPTSVALYEIKFEHSETSRYRYRFQRSFRLDDLRRIRTD